MKVYKIFQTCFTQQMREFLSVRTFGGLLGLVFSLTSLSALAVQNPKMHQSYSIKRIGKHVFPNGIHGRINADHLLEAMRGLGDACLTTGKNTELTVGIGEPLGAGNPFLVGEFGNLSVFMVEDQPIINKLNLSNQEKEISLLTESVDLGLNHQPGTLTLGGQKGEKPIAGVILPTTPSTLIAILHLQEHTNDVPRRDGEGDFVPLSPQRLKKDHQRLGERIKSLMEQDFDIGLSPSDVDEYITGMKH